MQEIKSSIEKMKKRDGRIVEFDPERIVIAIGKALKAAGTANDKVARNVARHVVDELVAKGYDAPDMIPDVDLIQDLVEHALITRGLPQAAKLYILYRASHDKLREGRKLMMDVQDLVSSYLGQEDWRVNENSNSGYSYASLLNHVSGAVIANYTLANIYPKEIAEAHQSGDFHLHDLSCGIVGYCAGCAGEAFRHGDRSDRELPLHSADGVGGGAGVQLLRYPAGALRAA